MRAATVPWIVFGAFSLAPCPFINADDAPAATQRNASSPSPRITVSKKTTHILQPLDKEGYVDYLAALNQIASEGVTPENNAGVLFVRALGLSNLELAQRARFCKLLKIEPLREPDEYFTEFDAFVNKNLGRPPSEKEEADFDKSMKEPWAGSEFPLVAEWLKSNQKPLDLVVDGTRRAKCDLPLLKPEHLGLITVLLPTLQPSRAAASGLAARAMLRVREGRIAEAEQDLMACHRLGRLVGSTPFLMGALVGIAVDAVAFQGDTRLMEYAHLSAERALAYQQELRKLSPLPVMADVIDVSERFVFLDALTVIARQVEIKLGDTKGTHGFVRSHEIVGRMIPYWDAVLTAANEAYDKWVIAARKPTAEDRKTEFEILRQNLRRDTLGIVGKELFDKLAAAEGPRELEIITQKFRDMASELASDPSKRGGMAGSIFKTQSPAETGREMATIFMYLLMPAIPTTHEAEDRARMRESLEQLGFALTAYRADHSAYPERLSLLAPRYISQVPNDLYTGQPLHYSRKGDGFLLYSVGANGADDGGLTFDSQPQGDDIVLEIPRRVVEKK